MKNNDIENQLIEVLADSKLSNDEKYELSELVKQLETEETRFLRNKAFALARQEINNHDLENNETIFQTLKWLEHIVKIIDNNNQSLKINSSAHFSHWDDCRRKLIELCHQAKQSIDICVFTISDNRLSQTIINAFQRGVVIRIITDDDKTEDMGSDIELLMNKGINIRSDNSPNHMHHKFAIFDNEKLANGSFNWTRSASDKNQENLLVTNDSKLVTSYIKEFDNLWSMFS